MDAVWFCDTLAQTGAVTSLLMLAVASASMDELQPQSASAHTEHAARGA
jgi:hypothetical protein